MPKNMHQRSKRVEGDPCQCRNLGHGHDGYSCDRPVYGRTRAGKVKLNCDECSHYNWLKRTLDYPPRNPSERRNRALMEAGLLSDQLPPTTRPRRVVTPEGEEKPPQRAPQQPAKPPARVRRQPDIMDEPF